MDLPAILLLTATILSGLVAGLLYAYSCSVNPGLGALPDREYLAAMQSINKAIQNPLFFLSFMGTLLLLPASSFASWRQSGMSGQLILLLSATLIYIVAVFGTTMFGNVPLNEQLAKLILGNLSAEELKAGRLHFETPWNGLHQVRTLASVLTFVLMVFICWGRNRV